MMLRWSGPLNSGVNQKIAMSQNVSSYVFRLLLGAMFYCVGLCPVSAGELDAQSLTEDEARSIALTAAGCRNPESCIARGYLKDGNWIFVVSFVTGHDPKTGKPLLTPGGWVGLTIDPRGKVIDRMPGA